MWINLFVFQTPDGNRFAKEISLECGFIWTDAISNFNTILNPLGRCNWLAVLYFPFGLCPNNWAHVASNLNTQNALKCILKVIM